MLSLNEIPASVNRASVVDYDEEKDFGGYPGAEWQKPMGVRSNLDRFRLMVGITTAPSMQAHGSNPSIATRILQLILSKLDKSQNQSQAQIHVQDNATPRADQAQTMSSGNTDQGSPSANVGSITSSSMPRKDRVEVDVISAPIRVAHNLGIYEIAVAKGSKSRSSYKYASFLINLCLGLQIVVAAALTALGAADHSGSSITALGAINTVIAGFLTYLKGSGLPGKLKYFQHEWDKIRDYIEARERDLRVNDNAFDVNGQIDYIRFMFEAVKKDIDSNRADRFTSSGALHTMPENNDLQRMQKKKLVELGKSIVAEVKEAYHEKSEAARDLGKQAERQVSEKHVGVRDAVKALSSEMEEIKKRMHDSGELEQFLEKLLHHKANKPEQHQ